MIDDRDDFGCRALNDWRNEPLRPMDRPVYTPPRLDAPSVQYGTRFDGTGMIRPAGIGNAFCEAKGEFVYAPGVGIVGKI